MIHPIKSCLQSFLNENLLSKMKKNENFLKLKDKKLSLMRNVELKGFSFLKLHFEYSNINILFVNRIEIEFKTWFIIEFVF